MIKLMLKFKVLGLNDVKKFQNQNNINFKMSDNCIYKKNKTIARSKWKFYPKTNYSHSLKQMHPYYSKLFEKQNYFSI